MRHRYVGLRPIKQSTYVELKIFTLFIFSAFLLYEIQNHFSKVLGVIFTRKSKLVRRTSFPRDWSHGRASIGPKV